MTLNLKMILQIQLNVLDHLRMVMAVTKEDRPNPLWVIDRFREDLIKRHFALGNQ